MLIFIMLESSTSRRDFMSALLVYLRLETRWKSTFLVGSYIIERINCEVDGEGLARSRLKHGENYCLNSLRKSLRLRAENSEIKLCLITFRAFKDSSTYRRTRRDVKKDEGISRRKLLF